MARYIFIVSLRHGALYDYLLQRFSDDPNAQVILDRRRAERRQAEISVVLEIRASKGRRAPRARSMASWHPWLTTWYSPQPVPDSG